MHEVGHHLQVTAISSPSGKKDLFARSAYNRYYYSVFLLVREMLSSFDSKWSKIPHKDAPEILKGDIFKKFKREQSKALNTGDAALRNQLDTGRRALSELASILIKANATRVVADYQPSEKVDFTKATRFSLKNIEITEAHNWTGRVETLIEIINKSWLQINGK